MTPRGLMIGALFCGRFERATRHVRGAWNPLMLGARFLTLGALFLTLGALLFTDFDG
jgi:hypothetical protein